MATQATNENECDCCGKSWRNGETCNCHWDCRYSCENKECCDDKGSRYPCENKECCDDKGSRYPCENKECCDDEESEVEWEGVYGVKTVVKSTLVMAGGGSHWWNYIVEYTNGKQTVFIENKNGIKKCVGKKLIAGCPDECVRLVDEDYECGDGESLWDCDD